MKTYASGEDHLTVELEPDMSLGVNLRVIRLGRALADRQVDGLVACYPTNASIQVRFDTDVVGPDEVARVVEEVAQVVDQEDSATLRARVVAIPVWFDDPVTRACQEEFSTSRHDPTVDDLTFCARVNGLSGKQEMIDRYAGAPWIVSAAGFYPGSFEGFQLVEPSRQLMTPKYLSPRLHTPERTVGQAGCFAGAYPYASAGGYQMLGRAAGPFYRPAGDLHDFRESPALLKAGDLMVFQQVDEAEFGALERQVDDASFRFRTAEVELPVGELLRDPARVAAQVRRSVE